MSCRIRIVLAEDQTLVLSAIAALLALEDDIEIVGQACDGHEALQMVRDLRPHILVTDVEMPGLSGIELADAVAQENLLVKVIVVTTYARPGYLVRALAAKVSGYLLKIAPARDLTNAIRTVHGGGIVIPADLAKATQDAGPDPLTDRERDVLRLAEQGMSNKDISNRLGLSPGTVRNYLSEAASKLYAANRVEAARSARSLGWL
jgi:two-component system response regulator DesR